MVANNYGMLVMFLFFSGSHSIPIIGNMSVPCHFHFLEIFQHYLIRTEF